MNSTTHFQCDLISTFLKAFSGRDASQAFLTYHRRAFPHKRAEAAFHATDESIKYSEQDNRDFLDLCEQIEKVTSIILSWKAYLYEPIYINLGLASTKIFCSVELLCQDHCYTGYRAVSWSLHSLYWILQMVLDRIPWNCFCLNRQ